MITLDDRLYEAGEDLRQAATRLPDRGLPHHKRSRGRVGLWIASSLGVAALVALPIWLGAFDADSPLGGASDLEIIMGTGHDAIAFLENSVTVEEAMNLVEQIRQWDGVDRVAYVSYERTLSEFRELFGEQPSLVEIVENDPTILPASIRLLLTEGADAEDIVASLRLLPGVITASSADPDEEPHADKISEISEISEIIEMIEYTLIQLDRSVSEAERPDEAESTTTTRIDIQDD